MPTLWPTMLFALLSSTTAVDASVVAPAHARHAPAAVAATDEAVDEHPDTPARAARDDDDDNDEPSYFARFSPFSLDDHLDPMVDDNLLIFFGSGLLFCAAGNVWLPALLVGEPPDGYWTDAWVSWLLHVVGIVIVGIALSAASIILQPLSAAVGPLLLVFILVNAFYLMPVATINAYNRGLAPSAEKPKPKAKKPATDDDDVPEWMRESPPPRMGDDAPAPEGAPPPPPVSEDPSDAPDEILRY